MSNCGLCLYKPQLKEAHQANPTGAWANVASKAANSVFKNELELLLDIIQTLRGSLRHLNLSENDLRSSSGLNNMRFIDGLKKIYLSEAAGKRMPLMTLDLRGTCLIQQNDSEQAELDNLNYLLKFKDTFDEKTQSPTKLNIKIIEDEPYIYQRKTLLAFKSYIRSK
jgi:hypothetical protein